MPPEAPPALAAQQALAAHIRDPDAHPAPDGIEARRLRIYRELFLGNVDGLLSGGFPVIHRILGDEHWPVLVRDFYREHPSRTPLFTEVAREFLHYLEARASQGRGDPPWLVELAHYEWVELALQVSEAGPSDTPHDPAGDLLDGIPVLSPLAWPLAYAWPVHRLAPDHLPDAPPSAPTLLLAHRGADGAVRFQALSPMTYRLLGRLAQMPMLTGRDQLRALAREAGGEADAAFIDAGLAMLGQFRVDGVVPGTRAG